MLPDYYPVKRKDNVTNDGLSVNNTGPLINRKILSAGKTRTLSSKNKSRRKQITIYILFLVGPK